VNNTIAPFKNQVYRDDKTAAFRLPFLFLGDLPASAGSGSVFISTRKKQTLPGQK